MTATEQDFVLIRMIKKNDGRIQVEGNRDHAAYNRLEKLGWVTSVSLNLSTVEYQITAFGTSAAGID